MKNINKIITILTIMFIWLDVIFTSVFIHKFGIEIEANIVGRFLFQHPILLILVKITSTIIIIWLSKIDLKLAKISLMIIFIIYSLIIAYHLILTVKVALILK